MISPEPTRAPKGRDAAFHADSGSGEDENAIDARNFNHRFQCNPTQHYDVRLSQYRKIALCLLIVFVCAACGEPAPKTDAELGLNAQQANGRHIFERNCAACHGAYSASGSKGPSLQRLFRKQFLPSGLPANDRFVEQAIVGGRNMMPPMGEALGQQELDDLMAYLYTL